MPLLEPLLGGRLIRLDEGEVLSVVVQAPIGVQHEEPTLPVSSEVGGPLEQVTLLQYPHLALLVVEPHARLDLLGHLALERAHLHRATAPWRGDHLVGEAAHAPVRHRTLVPVPDSSGHRVLRRGRRPLVIPRPLPGHPSLEIHRNPVVEEVHVALRPLPPVLDPAQRLVDERLHQANEVKPLLEEAHVSVHQTARGLHEEAPLRVVDRKQRPREPEPVGVVRAPGSPKVLLGLCHHVVLCRPLKREKLSPRGIVVASTALHALLPVPHRPHRPQQHVVQLVDHQQVDLGPEQVIEGRELVESGDVPYDDPRPDVHALLVRDVAAKLSKNFAEGLLRGTASVQRVPVLFGPFEEFVHAFLELLGALLQVHGLLLEHGAVL
mmetsp:Transcript_794/g.3100  ORF Transcript_794/g.3100 Transcript_794/m.3100 type:complete len:380 (-) Transcript_794:133-1272(-)